MTKRKATKIETAAGSAPFTPDAYVIRTARADGTSYNGFKWPAEVGVMVECPDWKPTAECGNGLHGLLDGIGDWGLTENGTDTLWLVVGVMRAECVVIDDAKVKFPRCRIEYAGAEAGAKKFILPHQIKALLARAEGNMATGYSGHAAATGYRGHAAATGDRGHAAATGDRGHAAATGKDAIAASLGFKGTAKADQDGWLVLAAYDDDSNLLNVRAAKVGTEGIEPDMTYRLDADGNFVRVEDRS